jgi:hypothetical protein
MHRKPDGKREHKWPAPLERRIADMVTNRLPKDYELVRKGVAVGTGAGSTGLIRKRQSHHRPAINFALHDSRPAVKIHDGFHEGQAQT